MSDSQFSNRTELEHHYREKLYPLYETFVSRLHTLLNELINNAGIPIVHIEYRPKTVESFLEKIERRSFDRPLEQIKDFAGLRIITYYLDSIDEVTALIRREFEVDETFTDDKLAELHPEEFGYQSVHLTISLSHPRNELDEWKRFAGLSAEIQIRSFLQHAWAVLSHTLDYKAASQIPHELRRHLFRLSAQLEQIDEEFMSLLKRAEQISEGYKQEMSQGKFDLPLDIDSLQEFMEQQVDLRRWENFGVQAGMEPFPQIVSKFHAIGLEILLLTLQTIGIPTIAEFEGLFSGFDQLAECLRQFVDLIKSNGKTVHAVPVDVLIILVSFSEPGSISDDFDWGGKYEPIFVEALREVCKELSKT